MNTAKKRVVHVPLTDTEWKSLRVTAISSDRTIGQVVREAYLATTKGSNKK